jgi:signal recognition particle subunit SRP54
MDTLDVFYPERMAQRILGMGDITTLVEKAQEQFDEEQAKNWKKRSAGISLTLPISNNK